MNIEEVMEEMRLYAEDDHYDPDVGGWLMAIEAAMREKEAEIEDKEASLDMMRSRLGERETLLRQCRQQNERIKAARVEIGSNYQQVLREVNEQSVMLLDRANEIERLRGLLFDVLATKPNSPLPPWLRVEIKDALNTDAALAGKEDA